MPQRSTKLYFDIESFIYDVHLYRKRHCMSMSAMARQAGISPNNMTKSLSRFNDPSLATVCFLADLCDLSLDKYRLERTI